MITSSVRRTIVSALYLSMSRNKSKSAGSGGPSSAGSKSTPGAVDGDVQQAGVVYFFTASSCSFASDLGTPYYARRLLQAISVNQVGDIVLRIQAKPGAKRNAVVDITDVVSVAIAAPPRDGEANQELIEYIASVLDLKKSQVSFDFGARSRSKIIVVNSSSKVSAEQVRERLRRAVDE